jgi:hypothetical protein
MAKSDWSGLEKLQRRMNKIEGTNSVSFNELFNAAFMHRYTQHAAIDKFFDAGGFVFETEVDFESVTGEKLDEHVRNSTSFSNWDEMLSKTGEHWLANELGF